MTNQKIFEDYKPILRNRFIGNVNRTIAKIREALGPELKGVYNDWTWAKVFGNVVKSVYNTGTHQIDVKKLNAAADQYADDTVNAWKLKIEGKLGDLDEGEVKHLNGSDFVIVGIKQGHKVQIFQQMIINISISGTLFNQFPSYIHLDGKRISAKKFKEKF